MPGEKSLDGADDANVSELGVYDLPPTQPEVASEPHGKLKKTTIGKRNRVLTHEQVIALYSHVYILPASDVHSYMYVCKSCTCT